MPELPEVESTVRYLRERVEGLTITGATIGWARTIHTHTPKRFVELVEGASIREVFRRGKFVGLQLSSRSPLFLFIHLRMSGSLDVVSAEAEPSPHDRVVLLLKGGKSIRFNDTRKFGRMYLCEDPAEVVGALGVEPLDESFSLEILREILRSRGGAIKPLLLNQNVIAGLGNIYVDEVLWKASIHPLTPADSVPPEKIARLHQAIKETLSEAISLAGTDFGDGVVYGGMYRPLVYGRDGDPCDRCQRDIEKIVVAQRGTHFCPACQKRTRRKSACRA
jgi:formamidopyrimidine-DNA glycosylase